MAEADAITDATLRHGYLHYIPYHRDIAAAWATRDAPGKSPSKLPD
jgi:hypothetical protein